MKTPMRSLATRLPAVFVAACGVGAACSPRGPAVVAPVQDPQGLATELRNETGLREPLRIIFSWRLNEGGQRVQGRGVARVESPDKARLDLFLENGETVVSAALVGGDLRMPAGAREDILPPPDLLWGALGVFRPREGSRLLGAERLDDGASRLRYDSSEGGELHYMVHEGGLTALELVEGGHAVQWVRLARAESDRYPVEATYRNTAEFRELRLERESLDVVAPFDPDIWDPRS